MAEINQMADRAMGGAKIVDKDPVGGKARQVAIIEHDRHAISHQIIQLPPGLLGARNDKSINALRGKKVEPVEDAALVATVGNRS